MSRAVIGVFLDTRGLKVVGSSWHEFVTGDGVCVEIIACVDDHGRRLMAFDCCQIEFKITTMHVKEMIELLLSHDTRRCIIFYNVLTPVAKQTLRSMSSMKIETIHYNIVCINPLEHELVPVHELAHRRGTKERDEFLTKYGPNQPQLRSTDVIALYHGFRKGDIVLIHRLDGSKIYRIVV